MAGGGNPNHDDHGRFSSGDGGGAKPIVNGKPGSQFTKGYRMANGTYVPPQDKAALGRAVAARYNGNKPDFAHVFGPHTAQAGVASHHDSVPRKD